MEALLKRFDLLMQCAGPTYSAAQLEEQQVIDTLRAQVDELERKFVARRTPKPTPTPKAPPHFSFDNTEMFHPRDGGESEDEHATAH